MQGWEANNQYPKLTLRGDLDDTTRVGGSSYSSMAGMDGNLTPVQSSLSPRDLSSHSPVKSHVVRTRDQVFNSQSLFLTD